MIQQTYQPEAINGERQVAQNSIYRPAYLLKAAYKMSGKVLYQFARNTFIGFQLFIEGMDNSGYRSPLN